MIVQAATNPTALITQLPVACGTSGEVWFGLLSGMLFGLLIYAVFDAMVYAFVLRRKRW